VAKDTLLSLEGNILKGFIHYQFNPENKEIYDELRLNLITTGYNPLLLLSVTMMATRLGQPQEALILLNQYKESTPVPYPFYYFLSGELKTNIQLNGEEDLKYFLKVYRGKNYIKSTWLKLGWNYLLKYDTLSYRKCIKNTKEMGVKWIEADINAQFEAEMAEIPNIILLKARLLFDGGLFAQSRDVLSKEETLKSLKTTHHRLEYIYRLARVNHSLNEIAIAKRYYKQVVQLGKDFPYYYAANSALQLGKIYEAENDLPNAKKYYEACLSLNKYNYATSVEIKADEGLRRINR
jgi:tetratricopeptide (TPR) repeat protein